jgi:hypothetical protein
MNDVKLTDDHEPEAFELHQSLRTETTCSGANNVPGCLLGPGSQAV